MIQMTPQMRILVAAEAVDFRKGIDGLARVCQQRLDGDPFSGSVFIFRNRSGTGVKILVYDGRGFWLCHKRLSSGRFRFWPSAMEGAAKTLEPHEVQVLLAGGDPAGAPGSPLWRRVDPPG
jgi:transposase